MPVRTWDAEHSVWLEEEHPVAKPETETETRDRYKVEYIGEGQAGRQLAVMAVSINGKLRAVILGNEAPVSTEDPYKLSGHIMIVAVALSVLVYVLDSV